MAVYVDREKNKYRRIVVSHMLADTLDELHDMAKHIGLKRTWFQSHSTPHYDLCQTKRSLAIRYGAIEIGRRQTVELIRKLRSQQTQDTLENYIGQKVGIYRNLNRGGFSVHAKAGKSLKVVGYCQSATLHSVELKVSEPARQRIICNRRREVHAIAYGTLTSYGSDSINHSEDEVSYNPYKFSYFYRKSDNSPVSSLEAATFTDGRMFAGPPASPKRL